MDHLQWLWDVTAFHSQFLIVFVLSMAGQKTSTPDGPNFDQVRRSLDNDYCSSFAKPDYQL
jgi:hypothetical protein